MMTYTLATPVFQPAPAPHSFNQGETGSLLSPVRKADLQEITDAALDLFEMGEY